MKMSDVQTITCPRQQEQSPKRSCSNPPLFLAHSVSSSSDDTSGGHSSTAVSGGLGMMPLAGGGQRTVIGSPDCPPF